MGKLLSAPKAPPRPTYVHIPAPPRLAPNAAPRPAPDLASGPATPTTPDPPDEAAQRVAGFLAARRGRVGTVLTGFRGFLDPAAAGPTRKTLLGE